MASESSPFPVTVHPFTSPTRSSCAYERGSASSRNALVFIGGLSGGPHTANPILDTLSKALEASRSDYSLWEFRMRSSYTGFGYSSLANDVGDTAALVTYLRGIGKEKIVLLGHSTGCQGIMEYTNAAKHDTPPVDAYILGAPVSDRETAVMFIPPEFLAQSLQHATSMIADGKQDEIMPDSFTSLVFTSPVTAYRWHSLVAKDGDDDYFSSDLPASTLAATFGRLEKPTLVLPSQKDELVPPEVDKEGLLRRWAEAAGEGVVSAISGLNPGADHTLCASGSKEWIAEKVVTFLASLRDT